MEYRISRAARDQYDLGDGHFATRARTPDDGSDARRTALRMAQRGGSRRDRPVHAGDLSAIGLLHELQHRVIDASGGVAEPARKRIGALTAFEDAFPSEPVYLGGVDPRALLKGGQDTDTNRERVTEELLLLWIANRNPAVMRYDELFDEHDLASRSDYERMVAAIRRHSAAVAEGGSGVDFVDRLLEPARNAPDSLADQLRWIGDNWTDLLDPDTLARLTRGLDVLAEEELASRRSWERHVGDGGGGVQPAALAGFGDTQHEPEAFSADRDWMPDVVLMAKSTYVWLDQLSRAYQRPIRTLDAIPDAELDQLRDWGFTGLWLIGLWERSHASQRIKQLRGNPEAVASAYSLMEYRIADDLGGDPAWRDLRDRAWERGIRLASDMVPNHMGIDSRWVMDHPEYFIGRDEPPFPSYSFTGPNLSSDERVGIYLEDHYADGSDAAVVFKRVDRWSGATRYLYHGNDGTSFPWNDTAQLDFLTAEVREQVILTILDVCRRFPVIRFDAAMVLAKKHVQRLWYPVPGGGGAIPSRSGSSMTQAAFDAQMPTEFWREVVDRVAAEAPDTLLLAEAFWLLEGYFVRTLGMHRVYNSAFMHMLRDEDNAGYRSVIRETVGFDARILGRYVNFMSNPDERTAIDQFGTSDKYLGVATLLVTMPGLPMFGHGQVEGFGEKYGMEFRRAMLDERPDPDLVARHEREIFPLLRQRWRFASADDFRMVDAVRADGSVDEDVFAYTNRSGDSRSLVVYRNRFAEGRVRLPGVGDALGVPDDPAAWVVLRDTRSGLEQLRNGHQIHARGLELQLRAYQGHVFLDPQVVWDDVAGDWTRLAWRLGLGSVPDVHAALQEQLLEPTRVAVARLFQPETVRHVAGAALSRSDKAARRLLEDALDTLREPLADVADAVGARAGRGAKPSKVLAAAAARLGSLVTMTRAGRDDDPDPDARALAEWLGSDRGRWATLTGWAVAACLGDLVRAATPEAAVGVFDAWGAAQGVTAQASGLDATDEGAARVAALVRSLLAQPVGSLPEAGDSDPTTSRPRFAGWFESAAVRAATGWNEWQGEAFVAEGLWREWLEVVAARDAATGSTRPFTAAEALERAVSSAGFRVDRAAVEAAPG